MIVVPPPLGLYSGTEKSFSIPYPFNGGNPDFPTNGSRNHSKAHSRKASIPVPTIPGSLLCIT